MFKNLNCLIGVTNTDNLVIFKIDNSNVDLKNNFVNNRKIECSPISKLLSFGKYLKLYEARWLKKVWCSY